MKKNIAFVTAIILLFSFINFSTLAADEATAESVAVSVNEDRYEKLVNIGAIYNSEDGQSLASNITKGEFAVVLLKFFKYGIVDSAPTKKPYVDVELNHPYIREIKTLKYYGFISSDYGLKFKPDSYITIKDAADIFVSALRCDKLGSGYALGAYTNITDGIKTKGSSPATYDDIYAMLDNCLDMEMLVLEENEYKKHLVSEYYYDLEHKRGIVTANSYTGISEASRATATGVIEIDGVLYATDNEKYGDLLGYTVDYYIDNSGDERVAYVTKYKKNAELTIDLDDVTAVSDDTITYTNDNNHVKRVQISSHFDLIYNKKAYYGYGTLRSVITGDGSVKLVDNNDDGKYDVIFVTAYRYLYVSGIDPKNECIYIQDSDEVIDLSDPNLVNEMYTNDGGKVNIGALRAGGVISLAMSKNTDGDKIAIIYVSPKPINGTLNFVDEDVLQVNDTEYKYIETLSPSLNAGDNYDFYLGVTGKIVYVKFAMAAEWNMGIVYHLWNSEEDETSYIRVYTNLGQFEEYEIEKKVVLNKTTANPTAIGGVKYVLDNVKPSDVIRYKLNKNGKISQMELADAGYDVSGIKCYTNETSLRMLSKGTTIYTYGGVYNESFVLDSSAVTFAVPTLENWGETTKFDLKMSMAVDITHSYSYEAYMVGDKDVPVADILVIHRDNETEIEKTTGWFIVNDISRSIYDDHVMVRVSGYTGGARQAFYCEEDTFNSMTMKKGDVFRLTYSSKHILENATRIFNSDGTAVLDSDVLIEGKKTNNGNALRSYGRMDLAKVVAKSDRALVFEEVISGTPTRFMCTYVNGCVFTRFDKEDKEISVIDLSNINVGDKVLIRSYYCIANEIVLLK